MLVSDKGQLWIGVSASRVISQLASGVYYVKRFRLEPFEFDTI